MIKVDDYKCFVCNKPIKELYKLMVISEERKKAWRTSDFDSCDNKEIEKKFEVAKKRANNKTVCIGKGLNRHSRCEPSSSNWMKNPKLRKVHEEVMGK
jgi:hypothetical protein|tara:strand:- start:952 stop:1245 length:294 start_codon:yes stop_codon:yes gene_type:complete